MLHEFPSLERYIVKTVPDEALGTWNDRFMYQPEFAIIDVPESAPTFTVS